MTHTSELRCMPAGSSADSAHVCIGCRASKGDLRLGWLSDSFRLVEFDRAVDDFPVSVLPSVPPLRRRYCWLHGIARLLSNAVVILHVFLAPQEREGLAAVIGIFGVIGSLRALPQRSR